MILKFGHFWSERSFGFEKPRRFIHKTNGGVGSKHDPIHKTKGFKIVFSAHDIKSLGYKNCIELEQSSTNSKIQLLYSKIKLLRYCFAILEGHND